jgi:hypothetical protein
MRYVGAFGWQSTLNPRSGSCVEKCFVQQIYIQRVVWGRAIPTTVEAFRAHLFPLFQCHDTLQLVLNIRNKLVMAGEDVYVYSKGEFEFVTHSHRFCT